MTAHDVMLAAMSAPVRHDHPDAALVVEFARDQSAAAKKAWETRRRKAQPPGDGWSPVLVQTRRPMWQTVRDDGTEMIAARAADGQVIEVEDRWGALSDRAKCTMLDSLCDAYDFMPTTPPPRMKVWFDAGKQVHWQVADAVAFVDPNGTFCPRNQINVNGANPAWRSDLVGIHARGLSSAQAMPAHDGIPVEAYTPAHEFGHVRMALGHDSRHQAVDDWLEVVDTPAVFDALSPYGRQNAIEAHAEAHAEWVLSRGATTNAAARWYAQRYGWDGHGEALAASGAIPEFDDVLFIVDRVEGARFVMKDDTVIDYTVENRSAEFARDQSAAAKKAWDTRGRRTDFWKQGHITDDDEWEERWGQERPQGEGDCFKAAIHTAIGLADQGAKVCHGTPLGQGQIEGLRFDHAWVEIETPRPAGMPDEAWEMMQSARLNVTVVDRSNGLDVEIPAPVYYSIGAINPDEVTRYPVVEALRHMREEQHYGPW